MSDDKKGASRRDFLVAMGGYAAGVISSGFVSDRVVPRVENQVRNLNLNRLRSERIKPLAGKKLSVGVIGVGNRATELVRMLSHYSTSCSFGAVCDIRPERIEIFKKRLNINPIGFTSYHKMLESQSLDAVLIATPNALHADMAVEALNKNIHVFLEKPMATTMLDCDRIIDAAMRSKAILTLGYELRYAPMYRKLRNLIQNNEIGDVRLIIAQDLRDDWFSWYPKGSTEDKRNWRYDQTLSGGSITEKLCHDFDVFSWMMKTSPAEVLAQGGRGVYVDRETLDYALIHVKYKNGARLSIDFSLFSPWHSKTLIIGSEGTLEYDRDGDQIKIIQGTDGSTRVVKLVNTGKYTSDPTFHYGTEECLISFLEEIKNNNKKMKSIKDGKLSVKVSLLAEKSVVNNGSSYKL